MEIIYARQEYHETHPAIYLAGPTPRSSEVHSWRPHALKTLEELHFTGLVIVPEEPDDGGLLPIYEDEQVFWEWQAMDHSNVLVFWIPRELKSLPGFTTNVEYGLYCRSGKIVLGYPEGSPKMRYLELLAQANNIPVHHDLHAVLKDAVNRANQGTES